MQQINLYSEILNQQYKSSGIQLTAVCFAVLILILMGFSGYEYWDLGNIQFELASAQQALNQEQRKVNDLIAKRPSQDINRSLLLEIDEWQNSVNEAAQTLQLLTGRKSELSQGFSGYFEALANRSSTDVWLTNIQIDGQSRAMNIQGSTFKPEQIPYTLLQLQQEPALKGLTFAKLFMKQSGKIAGQMDFILSSSEKVSSEAANAQ